MTWLLASPFLVFLLCLALALPYASFRKASRNTAGADGQPSRFRTEREKHHLTTFLRTVVLVPLVVLALIQGGLFAVHHYVLPEDTTLSELFGEFHPETSLHAPDLEAWNEAIDASRRDEAFLAWQEAQGLAPGSARATLSEVLLDHWPNHIAFLLVALAYLIWFARRRYIPAARTYHRGVTRRARRYEVRDACEPGVVTMS